MNLFIHNSDKMKIGVLERELSKDLEELERMPG